MKNRKNKYFKILIIIVDIIAIAGLLIITKKWILDRNRVDLDSEGEMQNVNYRNFTFDIPTSSRMKEINENAFGIENEYYLAVIEIFDNKDNYIFNKTEEYYNALNNLRYGITTYRNEIIDDNKAIVFTIKGKDKEYTLYSFSINDDYAVLAEVYLKDKRVKNEQVAASLMNIFDKAIYNESDTAYNYRNFDTMTFDE